MDEIYAETSCPETTTVPLPGFSPFPLDDVLFIPGMRRYERLKQQDIRHIKGDKSYVTLHLANGQKKAISTHLGNFMRYLDTAWFVRTSRSHVVNLRYVDAVTTRSVILADTVIPLTEAYRATLWERLPIVRLKSD